MPRVERKAPFICITHITKAFVLLVVLIVHSAVVPIINPTRVILVLDQILKI